MDLDAIVKAFKDGFKVYVDNFFEVLIGFIIVWVLSIITLGIMAPALWTGYKMYLLQAKRGKKVSTNTIFEATKSFWSLWGLCTYVFFIVFILSITLIGIIPAVLISVWWMYADLYLVDKKLTVRKAMRASKEIVRKNNFWMHIVLLIAIGLIGNIGYSVAYVGSLLTAPFGLAVLVAAYDNETKKAKK